MDEILIFFLVNQILVFILNLVSLFCVIMSLWKGKFLDLSTLIYYHFWFIFGFSIASLAYIGYSLVFWRETAVIYDARVLFTLGALSVFLQFLNTSLEFFICIERWFCIIFATGYNKQKKQWYSIFVVIAMLAMAYITAHENALLENFPRTFDTNCRDIFCFFTHKGGQFYLRLFNVVINLVAALGLILLIKFALKFSNFFVKRINRTILLMIVCSIIAELAPLVIYLVTNFNHREYVTTLGYTGMTVNLTISSIIYFNAVKHMCYHANHVITPIPYCSEITRGTRPT